MRTLDSSSAGNTQAEAKTPPIVKRDANAIYQDGQVVARVLDPEIDLEAKEIRFGEIYASDRLLLPEECEFQEYRILIQRIAFAAKVDRAAPEKGRVLRGVVADFLGYRKH